MNPKILPVGTAAGLVMLGLPMLFVPNLVAAALGLESGAQFPLQLFGGALYAFAALNWFGRSAVYGGIYGRPLVLANFILGVVVGGLMVISTVVGRVSVVGWIPTGVFVAQAAIFFGVLRRPPWRAQPKTGEAG